MLKLYLYPVVIIEDNFEEDSFVAMIPDLGISTDGQNIEEAYLYAKDYLRVFIENAIINDIDFNLPSNINLVMDKYKNCNVMLLDTVTNPTLKIDRDSLSTLSTNENVEIRVELSDVIETPEYTLPKSWICFS